MLLLLHLLSILDSIDHSVLLIRPQTLVRVKRCETTQEQPYFLKVPKDSFKQLLSVSRIVLCKVLQDFSFSIFLFKVYIDLLRGLAASFFPQRKGQLPSHVLHHIQGYLPVSPNQEGLNTTHRICSCLYSGHQLMVSLTVFSKPQNKTV